MNVSFPVGFNIINLSILGDAEFRVERNFFCLGPHSPAYGVTKGSSQGEFA